MITSKYRGHQIETHDGENWKYSDLKIPVPYAKDRACGHCGENQTIEGHDGCLKTLPGVQNACCGHGIIRNCYIHFNDGSVVRGEDAKALILKIKGEYDE